MKIVAQEATQLNSSHFKEMDALVLGIDPSLPKGYMQQFVRNHQDATFYLIYENEALRGIQAYRGIWAETPFAKGKLLLFEGCITYKHPELKARGLTGRTSALYTRKRLGFFWMFRPFVAIAPSCNPRLNVQFQRFFPEMYPLPGKPLPEGLRETIRRHSLAGVKVDEFLTDQGSPHLPPEADVTENWEKHYRTRNEKLNEWYFRMGIFRKTGDRIILTNKSVYVTGVYRPLRTFLHWAKIRMGMKVHG